MGQKIDAIGELARRSMDEHALLLRRDVRELVKLGVCGEDIIEMLTYSYGRMNEAVKVLDNDSIRKICGISRDANG